MAPVELGERDVLSPQRSDAPLAGDILEAWAQGFNVGALVVLALFILCNYRKGVLLHKLIVLELILALPHGTFIFTPNPVYDWYLPITATLLYTSYQVHNWVAFLKIRLFMPRWGIWFFVGTLILVQPYWVVEAYASFAFWRQVNQIQTYTRPMEAFFRDPWWIFTTCYLIVQIKTKYQLSARVLLRISPRFGVMILCMLLSIVFIIVDVVVTLKDVNGAEGVNPFWRLALVFKIAADTIFLDDFKSVLDKIMAHRHGSIVADTPMGTYPARRTSTRPSDLRGSAPPPPRIDVFTTISTSRPHPPGTGPINATEPLPRSESTSPLKKTGSHADYAAGW